MKVRIKLAETAGELDQVFRLRHRVYVEEGGYLAAVPERRVQDRYDFFPTTRNIVATLGEEIIGAARVTESSDLGTSAEEFYDFAESLPQGHGRWGCGSMLCVTKGFRGTPIFQGLMNMVYVLAYMQNWSHVVAAVNPEVEVPFRRQGWRSLTPTFFNGKHHLPYIAMLLDMRDLRESSRRIVNALSRPDYEIEIGVSIPKYQIPAWALDLGPLKL